jgi:hypothetical protein
MVRYEWERRNAAVENQLRRDPTYLAWAEDDPAYRHLRHVQVDGMPADAGHAAVANVFVEWKQWNRIERGPDFFFQIKFSFTFHLLLESPTGKTAGPPDAVERVGWASANLCRFAFWNTVALNSLPMVSHRNL